MGLIKNAVVFGAGYVVGTRAGRERYLQLKQKASEMMQRPEVQQARQRAKDTVTSALPGGGRDTDAGEAEGSRRRWRRGNRQDSPLAQGGASPSDNAAPVTVPEADTSIDLTPAPEATTTDRP